MFLKKTMATTIVFFAANQINLKKENDNNVIVLFVANQVNKKKTTIVIPAIVLFARN